MRGYFLFDYPQGNSRIRVIYCGSTSLEAELITSILLDQSEHLPPPDKIRFVVAGVDKALEQTRAIITQSTFADRFGEATRYRNPPKCSVWLFDKQGDLTDENAIAVDQVDVDAIKQAGMVTIFHMRGGLLEADKGYHYAKPSKKHSEKFLRVGNIVASSAEIEFIAFCLLSKAPELLRHIYCDTGAIFPVASAFNLLRTTLNTTEMLPSVDSFGSFDGLKKGFQFHNTHQSMVLISASTSGGLARAVCEHEPSLTTNRIVTLFYLGRDPPDLLTCDLSIDKNKVVPGFLHVGGFELFTSYEEGKCNFCDRGSTCIRLEGDQFLPGATATELVVMRASDSPGAWLAKFVNETKGNGIVRAFYSDQPGNSQAFAIFLDLEKLFDLDVLATIKPIDSRFDWLVNQNVPFSTTRIIYLDDPASLKMAQAVKAKLASPTDIPLIPIGEVMAAVEQNEHVEESGSSVIVASAIASGRSIQGVSQQLRRIQPNNSFQYLVGIIRPPTQARRDELKSNLTRGPMPHGLWTIQNLYLPLANGNFTTSWDDEIEFLKKIRDAEQDAEILHFVESRLETLNTAGNVETKGLKDNLFLRSPAGLAMKLQCGFVYLDDYQEDEISQAETFFAISAVLHHMRTKGGQLKQRGFLRKILSPRCFDRFNDGVIQASILRAAKDVELDYSTTEEGSAEMKSLLEIVLRNSGNQVGEASREFLLALALGRMQLCSNDRGAILKFVETDVNDPICKTIARFA